MTDAEEPNAIERILNDPQSKLEGVETTYTLAVNNTDHLSRWMTWHLKIPWWMSETPEQGRKFADTVRAALAAEGFEVRMIAETRFREELS